MKRTLFASAIVLATISMVSLILSFNILLIVLFTLLLILFISIFFRNRYRFRSLIPVLVIAIVFTLCTVFTMTSSVWKITPLDGYSAKIKGSVVEEPDYRDGYVIYIVKTETVDLDGAPQSFKLRLISNAGLSAEAFDKITANVSFTRLNDTLKTSCYSDKIYVGGYINGEAEIQGSSKPLYYYAIKLRQSIRRGIYANLPYDEASVLCGILLGDSSSLSDEIYSNVKTCGLSHIMAVSGMHLLIICQSLLMLLKHLRLGRRSSAIITMGAIFLIMAVTGFSPSIVRASIMYFILLLGLIFFKNSDALTSLGASILIILFLNPFAIGSLSLQLSALATLGLVVLAPKIQGFICSKLNLKSFFGTFVSVSSIIISQSVASSIATLPVIILTFGWVSLIAPFANLVVIYPVTLALILVILASVFAVLPFLSFLASPIFLLSGLVSKYLIFTTEIMAKFPLAYLPANYGFITFWIILSLILFGCCLIFLKEKIYIRITSLVCVLLLLVGMGSYSFFNKGVTSLVALKVKSGTAVIINQGNKSVLIASGLEKSDSYVITEQLVSLGSDSLDLVILPSKADKSLPCLVSVMDTINVLQVAFPDTGADKTSLFLSETEVKATSLNLSSYITFLDNIKVTPIRASDGYTLHILIANTAILLPATSEDLSGTDFKYRIVDLVICTANIPQGVLLNETGQIIVSGENGLNAGTYTKLSGEVYTTNDSNNITFKIRKFE